MSPVVVELEDDDDLPPPLEDMEPVIEKIRKTKIRQEEEKRDKQHHNVVQKPEVKNTKEIQTTKKKDFGGMQKGFLLGGTASKPKKKAAASCTNKVDFDVRASKQNNLVFDDVQKAMESHPVHKQVNQNVLKAVEGDEKLLRQLSQPKFAQAVELMKTNPREALERYKNDHEVGEFFKKFYSLLGTEYTKMGESAERSSGAPIKTTAQQPERHLVSEDEKEVERVLENEELRSILEKSSTKRLMEALRQNPDRAQHMIRGDHEIMRDVQKLIQAGLLKIQ